MAGSQRPLGLEAWPGLEPRERLRGGVRSQVVLASRNGELFVVRRSQREPAALAWELELLDGLADAGFVVPRPVPASDGQLSVEGTWVAAFRPGRHPTAPDEWARVVRLLAELHRFSIGYPQRPGFASSADLLERSAGGDVNLDRMPRAGVAAVRSAWAAVQTGAVSVVHADPGPSNILVGEDGSVALIDWDESRVDVGWFDLAAVPRDVPLPADTPLSRDAIVTAGVAWEAATSWVAEPDYARRRLSQLRSRQA